MLFLFDRAIVNFVGNLGSADAVALRLWVQVVSRAGIFFVLRLHHAPSHGVFHELVCSSVSDAVLFGAGDVGKFGSTHCWQDCAGCGPPLLGLGSTDMWHGGCILIHEPKLGLRHALLKTAIRNGGHIVLI